ncbi:MAG: Transcriptional regulator, AlpA family (modular protein) [Candidatus Nitrospira kreftii]|uniref:Transcriptional regulator, AlpA family (Modular protein) n=1 Tax=Candidatus Nitrospira kreftii TaxID=2652173 RepID=A0A7S8FIL5_9BACT|nr:MAG: Transcriptional regulator, AlpA family (modular protein) [Candidatus Nitrospira kreftii]
MPDTIQPSPLVLRLKDLQRRLALSRSAIYARMAAGDFPPPIQLGPRAIGWRQADIDAWVESRTRQSHSQAVKP